MATRAQWAAASSAWSRARSATEQASRRDRRPADLGRTVLTASASACTVSKRGRLGGVKNPSPGAKAAGSAVNELHCDGPPRHTT